MAEYTFLRHIWGGENNYDRSSLEEFAVCFFINWEDREKKKIEKMSDRELIENFSPREYEFLKKH